MQGPASLNDMCSIAPWVSTQGTVICYLRPTDRISEFRFPLDQVGNERKNMYSKVTLCVTLFFFFLVIYDNSM